MITLTSAKDKFFISGDLVVNPRKTTSVDENTLTERQLRDIITNIEKKDLIASVEDLGAVQSRLSQLTATGAGSGTPGGAAIDPITLKRIGELERKVKVLEDEPDPVIPPSTNTTIHTREELMWTTTEW